MRKLIVLLFLVSLAACSQKAVPLEISHATVPPLHVLASLHLNKNTQARQTFIAVDPELEKAGIPDKKPGVEIYQVADESLLIEPEFMEPIEPEFMKPEEPEFMEPEEPEFVQPEMPEFMKPSHPDFLEPSKPEITDSEEAEAAE